MLFPDFLHVQTLGSFSDSGESFGAVALESRFAYYNLLEAGWVFPGTDERQYQDELRRAAKTVLLSIRPESGLH